MHAIEIEGLSKRYPLGRRGATTIRDALTTRPQRGPAAEVWSLRDLDLTVEAGESVAVIGRNGAGKTTLLRILARITEPTAGVCRTRGRVGALLEVGAGFHPELTGRENVYLNGAILGMARSAITRQFDEIVEFAGVERFLETPVKRYSSGMYLRLAFAVAAHLEPEILAIDEVLAVGDAEFQRRCLTKMSEVGADGRTVLFVSHDLDAAARLCSRAIWLEQGRIALVGDPPDVIGAYLASGADAHPYRKFAPAPGESVSLLDARVANVEVDPSEAVLRRERPLVIDLTFVVHEPVPGLNLAAYVTTARGTRVIDEVWRPGDAATAVGEPGTYRARIELPAILNVGEYTLGVWIGNTYDDLVDLDEVLRFRLEGPRGHRSDRILNLESSWSVVRR